MEWIDSVIFGALFIAWACFCFHVQGVYRERARKQRAIDLINKLAGRMHAAGWDVEIGVDRHR